MICCGCVKDPLSDVLSLVPLPLPAGVATLVADPGTGPHVKSRLLALPALMLPAAGELNLSAAVGECMGSGTARNHTFI